MTPAGFDQKAVKQSLAQVWLQLWDQVRPRVVYQVREQVANKIPSSGLVQVRNQVWSQATEESYESKRRD